MPATICQVMGFALSLLGVAGIIAATGMDQWATQDLFDNPVTAVFSYSGLWNSCVRQSSGFTECRPYFTILGLPCTTEQFLSETTKMAVSLVQLAGFMLSMLGVFLISAATAMDMWSLQDRSTSVVTNFYTFSGLWNSCVGTAYGTTQCRPYFTILGLPALLQAVRALMIVGIVLGVIGDLIAIFALKCLKMGSMEDNIKATMSLTAGVMFILGGICGIAGASAFANLIVQSFRFTTYADGGFGMYGGSQANIGGLTGNLTPRYTFGPALFVGWVGGAILFISGIMMCLACRGMVQQEPHRYDGMAYKPASQHATTIYKPDSRSHQPFNNSYRVPSVDGRQSGQRFDYV